MLLLIFSLVNFAQLSLSFELNIQTKNNINVKLFNSRLEFRNYCLAEFSTKNDLGENKYLNHEIDDLNELDLKMPWLATDNYHTVCFHNCNSSKVIPICVKFTVPRIACESTENSIKLNLDETIRIADQCLVRMFHFGNEISSQVIENKRKTVAFENLTPESIYNFDVSPRKYSTNEETFDISYQIECTTRFNKDKLIFETTHVLQPQITTNVPSTSIRKDYAPSSTHKPTSNSNEQGEILDSKTRMNKMKITIIVLTISLVILLFVIISVVIYLYKIKARKSRLRRMTSVSQIPCEMDLLTDIAVTKPEEETKFLNESHQV